MQCPNCGKTVRSKTQCAFCGFTFTEKTVTGKTASETHSVNDQSQDALHETMEYEAWKNHNRAVEVFDHENEHQAVDIESMELEELVPEFKPKRRRGFIRVIFSILQMVLVLIVLFLAFLYGPELPKYLPQALNRLGIQWGQQTAPTETSSQLASESSSEESSIESTATVAQSKLADTANYPFVVVTMTFERPLENLTRDTFKFSVEGTELTDYSLIKEGNNLILRYVDPSYSLTKVAGTQVNVEIKADSLNYTDRLDYQVPDQGISQEQVTALEAAFKTDSNQLIAVQEVGAKAPFLSSVKTSEASHLFAWFVLARTYQLIDENKFTLDTEVEIQESLRLGTDNTAMATQAIGSKITIAQLIDAVVTAQDPTALNYLVQQVGGPNELNLWLNNQSYYSTKMNANLSLTEAGDISGVTTSAYDLVTLLNQLGQDRLVNERVSAALKEAVLKTPISTKFPGDLVGVIRRYEMTTPDNQGNLHHYAAILELEGKSYVVVLLGSSGDAELANTAIASQVRTLVQAMEGQESTASTTSVAPEESSATADDGFTQVEVANPNVQPAPVYDYFDDDGDGVLDPTPRLGRWYWDTDRGTWLYY